jgi:glycine/D-amino acid oxidase-like deaminating enzyme
MDKPVVVIGSGIVGSAIALELQRRGATTILVDRDIQPQGASVFSFASLTAFDEPLRDVYLLKTLGMVRWRELSKLYGDDLGVRWDGEIRWAEETTAAEGLRVQIDKARGRGYPVRSISADEIQRRLPASAPQEVLVASLAIEDGQVEPILAINVLRQHFTELGGTIRVGRASLIFDDQRIDVRIGEERIHTSRVVVAAGAETGALLERFGWEIPMDPSPGLLVLTQPTDPIVTGAVYMATGSGVAIHLRQRRDGRVVIGERTQDEVVRTPTIEHAQQLLAQARASFPALRGVDVDHFTVEWRPMPRDGMPIVGPLPGLVSVYVATAHSGVTLAPAIGELVAREIVDARAVARLEPFRPGRFSEHQADAYRSIEEAFEPPSEVFLG